jgi:hypothetical protein
VELPRRVNRRAGLGWRARSDRTFRSRRRRADRERASDPRPSIEERYRGRDEYVGKLAASALDLVERGYLLPEDVPDLLKRAAAHYDWSMQTRGTAGK